MVCIHHGEGTHTVEGDQRILPVLDKTCKLFEFDNEHGDFNRLQSDLDSLRDNDHIIVKATDYVITRSASFIGIDIDTGDVCQHDCSDDHETLNVWRERVEFFGSDMGRSVFVPSLVDDAVNSLQGTTSH